MTEFLNNWLPGALGTGVRLLAILLVALILIRIVRSGARRLASVSSSDSRAARLREQQTRTLAGLLQSTGTVVVALVALLTALPLFGLSIAPLAAAAGLIGLAVGIGAQHLVRDILGGVFVLLEDQYSVGDTIRLGETTGRVELITLRRTLLRGTDGALVTLPNGEVRQVANLSRDWAQAFVDVPLERGERLERALEVLEGVATDLRMDAAWSGVLLDGPRILGVEGVAPGEVVVRLQMRCEPMREAEAGRELRRRIRLQFEKLGMTFSPKVSVEDAAARAAEASGGQSGQPFRRTAGTDRVRE